ncbi:energy transducer TonB [Salegentibacter sp. HM20]
MKKFFVIALFFTTAFGFSQTTAEGNKVTSKQTPPVWPGCEDSADKKDCFNQQLMQHIRDNYKYPQNDDGEYVRGKVTFRLEVNEEGVAEVKNIETAKPEIEAAVKQMASKIPKMQPSTMNGKPTTAGYTIPLTL